MKNDSETKGIIASLSSFAAFVGVSELVRFVNKDNNRLARLLGVSLATVTAEKTKHLTKESLTQNPEKELNNKIDPKYKEFPIQINYHDNHTKYVKSERKTLQQIQR